TAVQLDAWLDQIQDARGNEMVVVLDFCEAGSFLEPLKRAGRTVIAACGAGEPTYFVAGGLVSFSDAFFGAVVSGQDLAGAFGLARDAMSSYQGALADADGSGGYAPSVDPPLMAGVYLGPSFIAGKDIPQIGHVMGGQMLQGDTAATLWAYDIVSAYPLERVWCMVVPPGHDPDPQNPVADLPTLDLSYNATTGRYEARYAGFTELGTYKLVYYARDIWGSVSLPRPSFVEQAGYGERMIVVAGGATNDAQWSAVSRLAAWTYQTALARRLGKPALRYLSAGPAQDLDGDGSNDVYAAATLASVAEAITLWPTNAHRLNVYLLGSSTTNGQCRLNDAESLAASQLDGWLDAFQASNTAALVVMDFDGCGGYVPELKPPAERERIVIASAKAGSARLCALDGVYSFSKFFLSGIFNGKSVGAAFAFARDAVKHASGKLRQAPQLDDSGNGVPDQKNIDGLLASQRYLGAAFATGAEAPFIGSVGPTGLVVVGEPVTLWADGVVGDAGISNVWCAISAPDYDGTGDPPQIDLAWNAGTDRYEAPYSNLTLPGTYALTFFALDNEGQLSAPVLSLLAAGDSYEPDDTNTTATIFPSGETQARNFHAAADEDWVAFYAPTGYVFEVLATQLGTNSDLVLDLYYEWPDGSLEWVDGVDLNGEGPDETEALTLDLKLNPFDLQEGIYFLRVGCADTNLFGPGSDYTLKVWNPTGSGGVVTLNYRLPETTIGKFYVSLGPSGALAAGAAWRIPEADNKWHSDPDPLYVIWIPHHGDWHLAFQQIEGFTAPPGQTLKLDDNDPITVPGTYTPIFSYTNPVPQLVSMSLGAGGVFQFQSIARPGNRYAIEESTNLIHWVPLGT
ncbi:MAG: hypothetical protein IT577_12980, partial [Verrucomicrobiae bacterium]|nr:hypothetical protein [Verrucomicrobiae bacterium]